MRPVIRHFTEADVPLRTALLRESRFQANLTDFAVSTTADDLYVNQMRTIAAEHEVKRIFTICEARTGEVMGFFWATSIDWRNRSCELSFGILPRFRGGPGATAVKVADQWLRDELNMDVVVSQVLDHNTMLHSAGSLAAAQRVRAEFDSYTVGEWRAACYWSDSNADLLDRRAAEDERRRRVAERIRARVRPAS